MRHIEPIVFQCTVAQHQGSFQGLYSFVKVSPFFLPGRGTKSSPGQSNFIFDFSLLLLKKSHGGPEIWGISLNFTIPRVIPAFTKVCGAQSLGTVIHIPKLWGKSHYPGPMKILVNFHQVGELSSSFYHLRGAGLLELFRG